MAQNSSYDARPAVAQAIAVLRQKKGYTRAELAAKVETTEATIARWEYGTRTPTINNLVALSHAYETPVGDFFPSQEIITEAINTLKEDNGNDD